jgi:hypothetical protein
MEFTAVCTMLHSSRSLWRKTTRPGPRGTFNCFGHFPLVSHTAALEEVKTQEVWDWEVMGSGY